MKQILLLLLAASYVSHGQEQLKLTVDGVEPVVVQAEGKTAEELYNKAKDWLNTYYMDPTNVLKGQVTNDYLRVHAICGKCWTQRSIINYPMDYRYNLVIEFQQGKYRVSYTIEDLIWDGKPTATGYKSFFNKKGVRKVYAESVKEIDDSMNELLNSLKDYIAGNSAAKKKDW